MPRLRPWLFRLAALTLAPASFLLLAEAGLRLFGYGYPAAFLVPVEGREEVLTTNPRYGWRFFPRHLARTPVPLEIPRDKGEAYRVFVLGGSAARGTPDSAFGFGRVLEVLLEARYPGVRFEIENAAMTAVNSHVVRDVAGACARAQPDLFIVYLGNNEVVGPYGAGTVFGAFSPSLTAIRGAIALKRSRFGQLLDAALGGRRRDAVHGEWRGMEMFLEQRVAADDPRLEKIYEHFSRNLEDVVERGRRHGARTVLVTVATNLRDQPPFASLHRRGLTPGDLARWQALVDAGARAAEAGDHAGALASWEAAARIDDRHAELHFRMGRSLLALGRDDDARERLVAARDLDALRFRADSRINEAIRQLALRRAGDGTSLLDADRLFAEGDGGAPPLPGHDLFHEHVHLSFDGNLTLARAIAEHLADLLPERIRARRAPGHPPLTASQVAERLAFTPFDRHEIESDVLRLVSRPPFAGQPGRAEDLERRREGLARLKSQLTADAWRAAETLYRRRLAEDADDLELRRRFATLLQARRLPEAAIEEWRRLLARLPGAGAWRAALATALADAGRGDEALAELATLRRLEGESPRLLLNRGTVLETLERRGEAEEAYRRALELDPGNVLAAFNLATSILRRGELERATELFRELVARDGDFAPAHHSLGRCLEQQGRLEEAEAAYGRALAADPGMAAAHNSLGLVRERRGDPEGAMAAYRLALRREPDHALAHFNLADLLLSRGGASEAERLYARGLALVPDNHQARYNRAAALAILGREASAVEELSRVLAASPDHPGALNNLAWILATGRDPEVRDPARAVDLAERAARATGDAPEVLETLAVAYRASGRRSEAAATLERAVELARAAGHRDLAAALAGRLAEVR